MKQIILPSLLIPILMNSSYGVDKIYDATNIQDITAAAHPDQPNPLHKPAQPVMSITDKKTRSSGYGTFTNYADIVPSEYYWDKYNDYLTDGVAANPVDKTSGKYIYTQFSIKKVEVKVSQTSN